MGDYSYGYSKGGKKEKVKTKGRAKANHHGIQTTHQKARAKKGRGSPAAGMNGGKTTITTRAAARAKVKRVKNPGDRTGMTTTIILMVIQRVAKKERAQTKAKEKKKKKK